MSFSTPSSFYSILIDVKILTESLYKSALCHYIILLPDTSNLLGKVSFYGKPMRTKTIYFVHCTFLNVGLPR